MILLELEFDHYAVLGVAPSASQEEIKKAWRRFVSIYHPDKHPGRQELAAACFRRESSHSTRFLTALAGNVMTRSFLRGQHR
jgi:curved DNA-binding protein CbpA